MQFFKNLRWKQTKRDVVIMILIGLFTLAYIPVDRAVVRFGTEWERFGNPYSAKWEYIQSNILRNAQEKISHPESSWLYAILSYWNKKVYESAKGKIPEDDPILVRFWYNLNEYNILNHKVAFQEIVDVSNSLVSNISKIDKYDHLGKYNDIALILDNALAGLQEDVVANSDDYLTIIKILRLAFINIKPEEFLNDYGMSLVPLSLYHTNMLSVAELYRRNFNCDLIIPLITESLNGYFTEIAPIYVGYKPKGEVSERNFERYTRDFVSAQKAFEESLKEKCNYNLEVVHHAY